MGKGQRQQTQQQVQNPENTTQTGQTQTKGDAGNAAKQDAIKSKTVDELVLDWAIQQVLQQVPQELKEYGEKNVPIILRESAYEGITNPNQVAYILATAEHETKFGTPKYNRSQTLVEDHNPYSERDRVIPPRKRGQKPTSVHEWTAVDHVHGQRVTAPTEQELDTEYWDAAYGGILDNKKGTDDASRFRGRGFVQLTGRTNYQERTNAFNKQGEFYSLNGKMYGGGGPNPIDLVSNPEHVNQSPELAAKLLVTGARDGSFRGDKLNDYMPDGKQPDFKNAREIINADTSKNGASIAAVARRYAGVLGQCWPKVFNTTREGGPR